MSEQKAITIRNVDADVLQRLADIRKMERRHLAVILEDCVQAYWDQFYEVGE